MPVVLTTTDYIVTRILVLRGEKVLLDSDLALLYGVETRMLKQAVRRNAERFPKDFLFELSVEEWESLGSQNVTLEKGRGKYSRYPPFARSRGLRCPPTGGQAIRDFKEQAGN